MQDFNRRKFLKTLGVSAVAIGLVPGMSVLKSVNADEVDWYQNINRVNDPTNLTAKEKGHAPFLQALGIIKNSEPFDLNIQIGENLHPMTTNHYIQWIEVYVNTDLISRVEFSPLCPQAKVTVPISVKEPSTLRILTRCNLHGIWETTKKITV